GQRHDHRTGVAGQVKTTLLEGQQAAIGRTGPFRSSPQDDAALHQAPGVFQITHRLVAIAAVDRRELAGLQGSPEQRDGIELLLGQHADRARQVREAHRNVVVTGVVAQDDVATPVAEIRRLSLYPYVDARHAQQQSRPAPRIAVDVFAPQAADRGPRQDDAAVPDGDQDGPQGHAQTANQRGAFGDDRQIGHDVPLLLVAGPATG